MNEADLPSINLDELRLVPDWLRDDAPNPSKQYASFDRPVENDYQDRRGPRPGGPGRDRRDPRNNRSGGGGERRQDRGRPGAPRGSGAPRRDERPPLRQENYQPPVAAAPVRVEFLPDDRCMASIIKQIRSTHMAYPLFSLARMFLQEPARHFLQLSLVPGALPGAALYQLGEDGPVTLDRAALEALSFDAMKDRYYKQETTQKDPPKGNFTNVAIDRPSGTLLGPTNYHGYQGALRSLYESRYSRRMSFEDFRRNVEISSDPAAVERWKEEARTVTTISTVEGEPPTVFPSATESKVHFRQNYLDSLIHNGMSFRLHGSVARRLPEPAIMQAIREAHEREVRYPAQFVQLLRQGLQNAGLHIFKHRKRIVYVAATRPTPFVPSSGAVTENVSLILTIIAASPLCTRKFLAQQVLSKTIKSNQTQSNASASMVPAVEPLAVPVHDEDAVLEKTPEAPNAADTVPIAIDETSEAAPAEASSNIQHEQRTEASEAEAKSSAADDTFSRAKAALAADLRFLVQAGHIIEFHNSTFDLPLTPKPKEEGAKKDEPASSGSTDDGTSSIGSDPADVQAQEASSVADSSSVPVAGDQPKNQVQLADETDVATDNHSLSTLSAEAEVSSLETSEAKIDAVPPEAVTPETEHAEPPGGHRSEEKA